MRMLFFSACTLLTVGAHTCMAATIFSENFQSTPVGTYNSPAAIGGFTVTNGDADVVGPGFFGQLCVGAAVGNCVDLNGFSAGTIATAPLSLTPGAYQLSFVLNGSQRGTVTSTTVSLGSLFTNTYTLQSSDLNTFNVPISVANTQNAVLSFASNTPGSIGALLDNVSLSTNASSVPEPSSVLLVAFGALSIALLRSRKILG